MHHKNYICCCEMFAVCEGTVANKRPITVELSITGKRYKTRALLTTFGAYASS